MISEERLRLAAQEAGRAIADSLPEPEDCEAEISPSFERKMKKVIWRADHRGLCLGLKRAACFFLVLLLCGGVWLGVDAEAREFLFGWVSEKVTGAQHYFHRGSDKASPGNVRYVLPEIPAGYEPYDLYDDGEGFVSNCYANDAGQGFSFEYIIGDAGEMFLLTSDIEEKRMVTVHGKPAEFYQAGKETVSNTLVWQDEETGALLYISGFFEEEYLIQLAESVVREENIEKISD